MAYSKAPSSPVGDLLQSEFHQVTDDPPVPTKDQNAVDYQYPWTTNGHTRGDSPRSVDQLNNNSGEGMKYSSSRSVTSESSRNMHNQSSALDNPLFAPPPAPPVQGQNLMSSKKTSTLPSFDKVNHSGYMLARTSLKSLVMKQWKTVFWITYGDHEVLIFRSKIDFEEWVTNPYLTKLQRGAIVKLHIDFQTGNSHSGPRCYRAFALQSKNYKSLLVTTFKLEQWMHYGPVILGAFASKSSSEIGLFHTLCKEMMKRHKCGLRHYLEKERNDDIDVQSHGSLYTIKSAPDIRTPGFY